MKKTLTVIAAIFVLLVVTVPIFIICQKHIRVAAHEVTKEHTKPQTTPATTDENGNFVYTGFPGCMVEEVNGNTPFFTDGELERYSYEYYSDLDSLGRSGMAEANVGRDTMPVSEREDISEVYPSGWAQKKYGDTWAYERCHLIAFCLTAENANEKNLITGTHDFNQAMIPYEVEVAQWVERTNGHCLVRVTPYYVEDELVARGVLYEAYSVEDGGLGVSTCVFIYNVSSLFVIDYQTGETL